MCSRCEYECRCGWLCDRLAQRGLQPHVTPDKIRKWIDRDRNVIVMGFCFALWSAYCDLSLHGGVDFDATVCNC